MTEFSLDSFDNVIIKCKNISTILSNHTNEELEEFFKYKVFLHSDADVIDGIEEDNTYLLYLKDKNHYNIFSNEEEAEYVQNVSDENDVIVFRNINLPQAIEAVNGISKLGISFCAPKYIYKMEIISDNILLIKVGESQTPQTSPVDDIIDTLTF